MILLLLFSCVPKEIRQQRREEGRYVLGELEGWTDVRAGGADYAWIHPDYNATFYTDSNCGDRYHDKRLIRLMEHQVNGIAEGDPTWSEELMLDGREALRAKWNGRIDGVPVALGTTVVKKGYCVYDMVLVAPRGPKFDSAWADYVVATDGFATLDSL